MLSNIHSKNNGTDVFGYYDMIVMSIVACLPILFLYLNTVIVTAGTFEP